MNKTAQRIYALLTHEYFLYVIVLAISIGTYGARAAVSIATVTLGLIGLLTVVQEDKRKEVSKDRSVLALTSIFIVVAFSGLLSSNMSMGLNRLFTNIPYLAIPVGIWAFGPFRRKTIVNLIMIFTVVTALSALVVMIDYATHFDAYNKLYKYGKTIPTPIIYVRYSYFLALAAVCCAGMLMDGLVETPRMKVLIGTTGVFLAICTHVLAVRTGVFALYGGVLTLAALVIIREGKWQIGVGAVVLIIVVSLGSIKFLPSASNKLEYVLHDFKMLTQKISPEYSDNIRYISIRHGINIFLENPFFGVGVGDIDDVIEARYASETPTVPEDRRFPPISQYVFWLASFGLVGTFLIIGLLIYPLRQYGKESYLLWGIYALTAFSFFGETTVQLQLGKTIFLLFVMIVVQWDHLRLKAKEV